jgi:hypothetical protein
VRNGKDRREGVVVVDVAVGEGRKRMKWYIWEEKIEIGNKNEKCEERLKRG